MKNIDELIEAADKLCNSLTEIANNERRYHDLISMEFEKFSWDMLRMSNDLKQIKEYQGA